MAESFILSPITQSDELGDLELCVCHTRMDDRRPVTRLSFIAAPAHRIPKTRDFYPCLYLNRQLISSSWIFCEFMFKSLLRVYLGFFTVVRRMSFAEGKNWG